MLATSVLLPVPPLALANATIALTWASPGWRNSALLLRGSVSFNNASDIKSR
jgi:hypothetical protein